MNDHYHLEIIFRFCSLLFLIEFFERNNEYDFTGLGRFWVISSFNKRFWDIIRELDHKWQVYLVNMQKGFWSRHFCVMELSRRKGNSFLTFSYFKVTFVKFYWVWRFIRSWNFEASFLDFHLPESFEFFAY